MSSARSAPGRQRPAPLRHRKRGEAARLVCVFPVLRGRLYCGCPKAIAGIAAEGVSPVLSDRLRFGPCPCCASRAVRACSRSSATGSIAAKRCGCRFTCPGRCARSSAGRLHCGIRQATIRLDAGVVLPVLSGRLHCGVIDDRALTGQERGALGPQPAALRLAAARAGPERLGREEPAGCVWDGCGRALGLAIIGRDSVAMRRQANVVTLRDGHEVFLAAASGQLLVEPTRDK